MRRRAAPALLGLASIAAIVSLLTLVNGPIRWEVGGALFTNRGALRPALIALVLLAIALALYGWREGLARARKVEPRTLAMLLAAATMAAGLNFASTVSAGSDAYGYVWQADRWLEGDVKVDQSWAAPAPWPDARWSFAPLGTRPSPLERWTIQPMYPPGLAMLMAAGKFAGGQEGVFWIVPITGAVLVLATFGIGRKLSSPLAGLVGAWLVATSPTVLFMLVSVMSDVPVAAVCALAFYFLVDRRRLSSLAAGLAFGLGVAIRPNLAPCVAVAGLWFGAPLVGRGEVTRGETLLQGALFSAGALSGAAVVAGVHQVLNGSPFISTYGDMSGAFSLAHFWPNLKLYAGRLVETQTPLALAGLAALILPLRALWPAMRERFALAIIVLFGASMWAMYCFYLVFDEWWYLRFLLPTWPFFAIGAGALVVAAARRGGRAVGLALTAAIVLVGVYQVRMAADRHTFDLWRVERRYVSVAREVRRMTDRASVIFSMQHSSSIRYYGGRVSVRYDTFEPHWIDRAVDWFAERGIHAYLLVDDWEIPDLERRFAGRRFAERIAERPLLHYRGGAQVYLYDLSEPPGRLTPTQVFTDTFENTRSVDPVTMTPLDLTRTP